MTDLLVPDLLATGHFGTADLAALVFLAASALIFGHVTEHPPARRPSVSVLMADYRREWMRQFVTRQPRIFDASVMDSLRQGTSFLASATMIAIGGCVAMIGNKDRLIGLAEDLTLSSMPTAVWEAKIIVILLFLTNAFLKFVWSHRVFGYCAVMLGAMPNEGNSPLAQRRAAQAATLPPSWSAAT